MDGSVESGNAVATPLGEEALAMMPRGQVLLVEDNEVNAFIAAMALESIGMGCVHAHNGEVAVALFREQPFDAVLMDCEMPVMDGYEAVRLMRAIEAQDPSRPRTPVIALTAHALSGDREICLARGMDEHLTKPFDPQALASALAPWLSRRGSRSCPVPHHLDAAGCTPW